MGSMARKMKRAGAKRWDKKVEVFQRLLKGKEPMTLEQFPWQKVDGDSVVTRSAALYLAHRVRSGIEVDVRFEGVGPFGKRMLDLAVEALEELDPDTWRHMSYAEFMKSDLARKAVMSKMAIEYGDPSVPLSMAKYDQEFRKLGGK